MQDKTLTCRDCGKDFTWTVSEQEFYKSKGFENEPVRCPNCRALKKARIGNQQFEIKCSDCGKADTVPFQPRSDIPVYCRECFMKNKTKTV